MAKIKNEVDKKPKTKSLFDHLNEIRVGKNPKYFETLSETDKKTWSNYMVCRFLSMQPLLVETINDMQSYQDKLEPKDFYRLCSETVPRGRGYYPYIKNTAEKYNKSLLSLLCIHFKECERNVLQYIGLLTQEDLRAIVKLYGYSDKQADELIIT
jgi:hypothetical protein